MEVEWDPSICKCGVNRKGDPKGGRSQSPQKDGKGNDGGRKPKGKKKGKDGDRAISPGSANDPWKLYRLKDGSRACHFFQFDKCNKSTKDCQAAGFVHQKLSKERYM